MSHDDHAGYCPTCFERQGPLQAHGLLYFWCMRHHVRWTTPARARASTAEDLTAVRDICQRTVLTLYARSWKPGTFINARPATTSNTGGLS